MSTLTRLARLLTACTVLRIDPLAVHIEAGDSGRHEVRLATCADWYDLASHWKVPIRKRDIRHHRVRSFAAQRHLWAEDSDWLIRHMCMPHMPCWESDPATQPELIGGQAC